MTYTVCNSSCVFNVSYYESEIYDARDCSNIEIDFEKCNISIKVSLHVQTLQHGEKKNRRKKIPTNSVLLVKVFANFL